MVVDFSALSIGTSFPFTRALLVRLDQQEEVNLHAMVNIKPSHRPQHSGDTK